MQTIKKAYKFFDSIMTKIESFFLSEIIKED
jgi:hypothetical protein